MVLQKDLLLTKLGGAGTMFQALALVTYEIVLIQQWQGSPISSQGDVHQDPILKNDFIIT